METNNSQEAKRAAHAAYMREYTARNKEKINAQRRERRTEETLQRERAWRTSHPESRAASRKRYAQANPEKRSRWNKSYNDKNREKINQKAREKWSADKPASLRKRREERMHNHSRRLEVERLRREKLGQKLTDYARAYYHKNLASNRLRASSQEQKRKGWKQGNVVSKVDYQSILDRDQGLCGICMRPVLPGQISFDHIIPLSRGGPHTIENIQLAHLRCNKSKGAKLPPSVS